MMKEDRRGRRRLLLLSLLFQHARAFYLPGSAPRDFVAGDRFVASNTLEPVPGLTACQRAGVCQCAEPSGGAQVGLGSTAQGARLVSRLARPRARARSTTSMFLG